MAKDALRLVPFTVTVSGPTQAQAQKGDRPKAAASRVPESKRCRCGRVLLRRLPRELSHDTAGDLHDHNLGGTKYISGGWSVVLDRSQQRQSAAGWGLRHVSINRSIGDWGQA